MMNGCNRIFSNSNGRDGITDIDTKNTNRNNITT